MVKKGYKQTEVGLIPEDWEVKPAKDLMRIETGSRNTEHKVDHGQYPFFVRSQQVERIDTYHYDCEAVLTAGDGVGTGKVFHYINGKFDAHQRVYVMSNFEGILGKYFFYFFGKNFGAEVSKYTAKSSVDSVRRDMIAEMLIPVPSEDEQKGIYEAVSDIEQLIETLEKQLTKKKAIKQGTMQELLTGKRRLPGFSGEWRYFNLMKNSKVKARIGWQGLKKSEYLDSGYALLVTGTDFDDGRVLWDGCHYVTRSRYEQDRNIQLQNNDILITKDGSLGKAALVQGLTKPATLNSGIFVIRPLQDAYDPVFVYQILSSFVFKNFLDRLSAGSTIIHLYQKDVGKFEFLLPPTIAEQKAIAEALSEMDSDIAALENKLTKYRQVKQGMMQQLLTGKIRLKKDVEDLVQAEQANAVKILPARTAHNHQFDDAVSIAAIVDAFYSDKYPLGRVKVQKLLYLLHRHQAVSVSDFKKKAAGPYADTVRYKGGEPIAKKNKYIVSESGKQGTRYSRGENMAQALSYVERWGMKSDLQWLKENFLHTSRNDLELFATVDMAMSDLAEAGISVSVESIKNLIASNKEWKAKLSKAHFSDWDIARAIKKCTELFN